MNELIERLEAATGPDRELDAAIAVLTDWRFPDWEEGDLTPKAMAEKHGLPWLVDRMLNSSVTMWRHIPAFTASIDAALTLFAADYPRTSLADRIIRAVRACWKAGGDIRTDLPRFICIAALRAHSTGMEGNNDD